MKTRREARGNWWLLSFCIECSLISIICLKSPQNQRSTLSILDLNGTLIMKCLTHYKYTLIEKIFCQKWKCLHGCLSYVWYQKETIWHLGLFKSPVNKFRILFKSKYEYCMFPNDFFSFYEKVPSALDHAGFFSKYFTATHHLQPN